MSVFGKHCYAIQFAFIGYALTADKAYRLVFGFIITNNGIYRAFCEHLRLNTSLCPRYRKTLFSITAMSLQIDEL